MPRLRYDERMPCHYKGEYDLSNRLDSCIIRYKGEPYFARYAHPDGLSLYTVDCSTLRHELHEFEPDDLDISFPELGYMNYEVTDDVYYLKTGPRKQYYQGLRSGVVAVWELSGEKSVMNGNIIFSESFEKFLKDDFPEVNDVLGITEMTYQRAISPELALKKEYSGVILVYYRGRNIGYILPDTDEVTLCKGEFRHVIERILHPYNLRLK